MKKIIVVVLVFCSLTSWAQVYPSLNVNLLGTLSPCSINNWYASGSNTKYSSVYGLPLESLQALPLICVVTLLIFGG